MVTNIIISGSIAGITAIALGTVLDYYLYRIGLLDNNISVYASAILQPKEVLGDKKSKCVGLIGHLIMGALFGVSISLTIYFTGYNYWYIKEVFVGAIFWLIIHQALTAKFWVPLEYNLSSKGVLWQFLIHLMEGLVTVVLFKIILNRA